ncbi:MAG: CoA transferase [Betaproteobacteria bacterium]|nr:CoA transferase [Betaproteobacteria bacterium]
MKVLQGVRVLDLGIFLSAPYAAQLLAELGADVIKVERPNAGDPFRAFAEAGGVSNPIYRAHNRHKRAVALDYTKAEGLNLLLDLVKSSDVFIMNVRPGVAEKLGLSAARLKEINPRLIYCAVTGFGTSGPYKSKPGYDNIAQALSGWLSRFHQGADARVPGPAVSDAFTGIFACIGILGALHERQSSGKGRTVEVNMLEATLAMAIEPIMYSLQFGEEQPFYQRGAMSQAYIVTCKDGKRLSLQLSSLPKFWQRLTAAIERPDILDRYPDRNSKIEKYAELAGELSDIFAKKTRDEWIDRLSQQDVPFSPERTMAELEADPQIQHLGVFYEMQHPKDGTVNSLHRPIRYDGSHDFDFRPAPGLGEHTDEVFLEIGIAPDELSRLRGLGVI